ncbi:MAG: hypothetical protein UW71_C0020G0002 [Parcubacteria group bacterium GW2011_GWB1_44_7]|nr:MAG: hypothetical protein UW71_C0020G0002 [Parcubacteria group bacterium GW2011_GWB1_44_7]
MTTTRFVLGFLVFVSAVAVASAQINLTNPNPRTTGSPLELHVDDAGNVKLGGGQVILVSGTTFYLRLNFGSAVIRMTVMTNKDTEVIKKFGGKISVKELLPGEYVSLEGTVVPGSDSFAIMAGKVKDWSKQTEAGTFSGSIQSISASDGTFILKSSGDRVIAVGGTLDVPTAALTAETIEIFQDQSIFYPRNFQGTLKGLSSTSLPVIMTVTIEGIDYTVHVPADAPILNNIRNTTELRRFVIGDTVRFFGSIRKNNLTTADAALVRNVSL